MTESFDPYLKWLGIRDPERPPNHYRLLGLDLYESDPEVINGAADRQMAHVRTFQTGPNAKLSQTLLNELAVARRCLLDDDRRAEYDRQLKSGSIQDDTKPEAQPVVAAKIIDPAGHRSRRKKSHPFWLDLLGWVGGGVAAVVVAYFLIGSSWLPGNSKQAKLPKEDPPRRVPTDDIPDHSEEVVTDPQNKEPENTANRTKGTDLSEPNTGRNKNERLDATKKKARRDARKSENSNQTDPSDIQPDDDKKPEMPPEPPAIAPWDAADRLPNLPRSISEPANDADRRFQPIYVGLGKRKYDLVKQFYPKVEPVAEELSQPIDVGSVLEQMDRFWQLVGRARGDLRVGDSLTFSDQTVSVAAVSDRSIELKWTPGSDSNQNPVVRRFTTDSATIDRDLAVAMARYASPDADALVDVFKLYDYAHTDLPVPPELLIGSGVALNGDGKPAPPDDESLREARKTILELYESEFAREGFLQQQALARKLLDDAETTRTDAMRYALLDEAGQLGSRIGDGQVVVAALSGMDNTFEVDFWQGVIDGMKSAQKNASTAMQYGTITSGLYEMVDRAVQEEQYETALRLSNDGLKAAKKLKVGNQEQVFEGYLKQLREMVEWKETGEKSLQDLESDPNNPKDHLAAARWLCFVKGDWEQGLGHLALCGGSKLERLAKKDAEISAAQLGSEQVKEALDLADAWYEAAQNNKGAAARGLFVRSHHWYTLAKDDADGLDRQKALLRQIELQPWLGFFDAYRDDEVLVQSKQWRFGTQESIVFQMARFRGSLFEYELPAVGNARSRTRNIRLTKIGDTYQIEPADTNSRVYLRLMRDGRIELLQYSLETGQLLAAGWGVAINP